MGVGPPTGPRPEGERRSRPYLRRGQRAQPRAQNNRRRGPPPRVGAPRDSALSEEEIGEATFLLASGVPLARLVPRFHLSQEALRVQLVRSLGAGRWDALLREARRVRHRPSETDLRQMLDAYLRGETLEQIARIWGLRRASRVGELLRSLDPEGWPEAKMAAARAQPRTRSKRRRKPPPRVGARRGSPLSDDESTKRYRCSKAG